MSGLDDGLKPQLATRVVQCTVCHFPHWLCLCAWFHEQEGRFQAGFPFTDGFRWPLLAARHAYRPNPFHSPAAEAAS